TPRSAYHGDGGGDATDVGDSLRVLPAPVSLSTRPGLHLDRRRATLQRLQTVPRQRTVREWNGPAKWILIDLLSRGVQAGAPKRSVIRSETESAVAVAGH